MSSTLMIPPAVVPRVREGAVALLTQLGEQLSDATWYPEQCEPLYAQVQEQWALLDVIGWADEDDHGETIEADIARIGKALKLAVEDMTPGLKQWLGEMDEDDPERPARAEELRLVQQFRAQVRRATKGTAGTMTRIPAAVVVLLRGALYTAVARACEDAPGGMPEAHTRSGWADVLARIDIACKALDVLGWDAPARQQDVEVELDGAMIDALEVDMDTWEWLAEQNKTESAEGRGRAAAKANTIKRFLASVTPPETARADAETTDDDA